MIARCGAQIRIEVVDRATGKMFDGELPDVYLEVSSTWIHSRLSVWM
jgi:hypothetical protein